MPLLKRAKNSHKNQFGHVCVIAGSTRMLGAAALTALAAMRAGAGLCTVAIPEKLNLTLQKKLSHVVMTLPLSAHRFASLRKEWHKFDVIAIGPGMGQDKSTQHFILKVVSTTHVPIVIDADALNVLAAHKIERPFSKQPCIMTPHIGEMARLTGLSGEKIEADRQGVTKFWAKKWNAVVLLKGRHTVVASPNGKVYINKTGNPGMATAGSGDVLTGMIAALIAQGLDAFEAACFGARLHGEAGDKALKKHSVQSLIATDIINYLRIG